MAKKKLDKEAERTPSSPSKIASIAKAIVPMPSRGIANPANSPMFRAVVITVSLPSPHPSLQNPPPILAQNSARRVVGRVREDEGTTEREPKG